MTNYSQSLMQRYPTIDDLAKKAKSRIPHIAWEYLDCGTGDDQGRIRNLERLAQITFLPRFMKGNLKPDVTTTLFGQTYQAPFGVAPVGMGGLIWPQAENILAQTASKYNIPYTLSTPAAQAPETIGPLVGEMGWFQLYSPQDAALRDDILQRAWQSGFKTLLVTVDLPAHSRRERMKRAGLQMPPKLSPRFILQGVARPSWSMATLRAGLPRLRLMDKYTMKNDIISSVEFANQKLGGHLTWDYLQAVRDQWQGPMAVKGILHPADAEESLKIGVDAVMVSNHGARQFNGAPATIDALPAIVDQVSGRVPILFDSGIRSGLDIIRALHLGADFVLLGRAFMFGVAALGQAGGDHVVEILLDDLKNNMMQLGITTIEEIKGLERGLSR